MLRNAARRNISGNGRQPYRIQEDLTAFTRDYLGAGIAHHEIVLVSSSTDRRYHMRTANTSSKYEIEQAHPRQAEPLTQPSAHTWHLAALRSATAAAESMERLWSGIRGRISRSASTNTGRGSACPLWLSTVSPVPRPLETTRRGHRPVS